MRRDENVAKKNATYLLPIWVDIVAHGDPLDILKDLNDKLTVFFENYGDSVAANSNSIDIQWSVNQHIGLKGRS